MMMRRIVLLLNLFSVHETTLATPESSPQISSKVAWFCNNYIQFQTNLCSPSHNSNFVVIKSLEQYHSAQNNLKDKRLPGILFYTAHWCFLCNRMIPDLEKETHKYPHITTYLIDTEQDGLESILSEIDFKSMPYVYFFKNGKKRDEILYPGIQSIKAVMQRFYGED